LSKTEHIERYQAFICAQYLKQPRCTLVYAAKIWPKYVTVFKTYNASKWNLFPNNERKDSKI